MAVEEHLQQEEGEDQVSRKEGQVFQCSSEDTPTDAGWCVTVLRNDKEYTIYIRWQYGADTIERTVDFAKFRDLMRRVVTEE